jgi:hypothetical protein
MPDKNPIRKLTASETEKRKKEIQCRAEKVYNLSFNYHLTHAVFGSDGLLLLDRKEASKITNELNASLKEAVRNKNENLKNKLMDEIDKKKKDLKRKYKIMVEYSDMDDVYGGRVVVVDDDQLKISLPEKLIKDIKTDDNTLQKEHINKIKKTMAHELAHIVLHADLLPKYSMSGSKSLDKYYDWEANVFAEELLRLFRNSTVQE